MHFLPDALILLRFVWTVTKALKSANKEHKPRFLHPGQKAERLWERCKEQLSPSRCGVEDRSEREQVLSGLAHFFFMLCTPLPIYWIPSYCFVLFIFLSVLL